MYRVACALLFAAVLLTLMPACKKKKVVPPAATTLVNTTPANFRDPVAGTYICRHVITYCGTYQITDDVTIDVKKASGDSSVHLTGPTWEHTMRFDAHHIAAGTLYFLDQVAVDFPYYYLSFNSADSTIISAYTQKGCYPRFAASADSLIGKRKP